LLKEDFVLIDGCKLKLDEADDHAFSIFGEEDKEERELIKKKLKEGDIVIDAGANIGYHTIIMAKYVGDKGQVYAFEPSPNNVELLKKTMKLNDFENVQIIDKAVSDKQGTGLFYLYEGTATHSLSDYGNYKGSKKVEITSLDHFFKDFKKKISFVKIDTEGYDFKVLKGMTEILKNNEIKLLIEFFPQRIKKAGDSPKKLLEFLFQNNFTVTDLKRDKKLTVSDIEKVTDFYDSPPPNHFTNLYCEKIKVTVKTESHADQNIEKN